MKRIANVYPALISYANIARAISAVNASHRLSHGRPNKTVQWVERTKPERMDELRSIIVSGFKPSPTRNKRRYDYAAKKWRDIYEPQLWPDQYIHHMVVQVLQPVMMRGMDYWCCGSIRGRGVSRGMRGLKRWVNNDPRGTRYAAELDIHHFYESLTPEVVLARLRELVKDERMLQVVRDLLSDGVIIGAYFSQWFANTVLQPLDHMIREQLHVRHYLRYMDNLTLTGSNKRQLHRAVAAIDAWLRQHGLRLKANWQVFRTCRTSSGERRAESWTERQRRRRQPRLINAMGYRYGVGYTLVRKRNLFRMKRQIGRVLRRLAQGREIAFRQAAGLLSRIGQLVHCSSRNIRNRYIPKGFLRTLKNVVRAEARRRKELPWTSTTSAPSPSATPSSATCA